MIHSEEVNRKASHLHLLARLDLDKLGVFNLMLGKLALNEAEGELGGIDGHIAVEVFQQVRKRARVVLVPVRDNNAAQLVGVLKNVGVIGQHEVNAGVPVFGKHKAGVIENEVAVAFEGRHVLSDGVKAAKRDDAQLRGGVFLPLGNRAAPGSTMLIGGVVFKAVARQMRALAFKLNVLERAGLLLHGSVLRRSRIVFFSH